MPVLFVGHGTPTSAIQPNKWTASWNEHGKKLPRPTAILSISAHWLTRGGSLVTMSERPSMNYDFTGFPREMYQIVYPARGDVKLAQQISTGLGPKIPVRGDTQWGFDRGTWVVLKYMFPAANIPVIQLSIDFSKPPAFHYEVGKQLQFLRSKGVLILGSGNIVHNLRYRPGSNNDQPFDWAIEFDRKMWQNIRNGNHAAVTDFLKLETANMAHPTYDHFLPLLYSLGLQMPGDRVATFNDDFQWPAVSMRSLVIT